MGNKDTTATGQHFNSPGHSMADLSITAIEQVKRTTYFIEKREKSYISDDLILYTKD